MFIGFSSQDYTVIESEQQVTICVEILNTEFGGALRQFSVSVLPEEGIFILCDLSQIILITEKLSM